MGIPTINPIIIAQPPKNPSGSGLPIIAHIINADIEISDNTTAHSIQVTKDHLDEDNFELSSINSRFSSY